jgi:molecular chaperone GrpE
MEGITLSQDETTQVAENAESTENDAVSAEPTPPEDMVAAEEASQADGTALEEQLAAAKKEAQENLEGRLRVLAEFQNYKRRVERELSDSAQKAAVDLLTKLLPIVDDFERGIAGIPEEFANHAWVNGVSLIQRKFQKLLDEYEVVVIDPVGEVFDPSRHEAVGVEANTEVESGHVTATLQKGYLYKDRVLRPALVRVAK